MVAILTGDIVRSRQVDPKIWMKELKSVFRDIGKSPEVWEIFRGDMFQVEVELSIALEIALKIKARIKQVENLDVRIAIGIGYQEFKTKKITESNGEAYSNSGLSFEDLKKRLIAIKTPWPDFNKKWNLHLLLASKIIDGWTPKTSEIVEMMLKDKNLNQVNLAKKMKKSQSTISAGLKRAGYDEIRLMLSEYSNQIKQIAIEQ